MYDVVAMRSDLDNAAQVARNRVKSQFLEAFKSLYRNNLVPDTFPPTTKSIDKVALRSVDDLNSIYYSDGFYVIFSNLPVEGNSCELRTGELRAIYRGECATTRKRVMSHLFHSRYKADYKSRAHRYHNSRKNNGKTFYEAFWPHCLKVESGGPSGVDIDQEPHNSYSWLVVVHRMPGSSQQVRELAELAFDEAFGHPAGSRDA